VEKLDTLPINVPILSRRKVMMKEPSNIRRKEKLMIKISSTRKRKHSLPKKTVVHQRKMKKRSQSFYLWE
jgi:hypothetical protein